MSPCAEVRVRMWSGAGEEQGTSWRVARSQDAAECVEVGPGDGPQDAALLSFLLPQAPILKVAKYLGKQSSRSKGWI